MISVANESDIPALLNIINKAYRGEESKKGWTTEAELIDGDIRTTSDELKELIKTEHSWILKYEVENEILGSVFLQKQNEALYLGMFSVNPNYQGKGIGRAILLSAEDHAKQVGCTKITMQVVSVRKELIEWYIRNGYSFTGEERPFPTDHKSGVPRLALKFIVLEKSL